MENKGGMQLGDHWETYCSLSLSTGVPVSETVSLGPLEIQFGW